MLRVEEFWVNLSWREEVTTDYKDLSGDISGESPTSAMQGYIGRTLLPRRWRFGCLDLGKQLAKNPYQVVVVGTPEDLRNECSALDQKLDREFQAHKHELGLTESVLNPRGTDVRSTIMQHDVGLPILEFPSKQISALGSRNIGSEGDNARDGLDRNQVDTLIACEMEVEWAELDQRTDDDAIRGHILASDLKPTSWRSAQVDTTSCGSQEIVFFVQLYQLER